MTDPEQPDLVWPPPPRGMEQSTPAEPPSLRQVIRFVTVRCLIEGAWRGAVFGAVYLVILLKWMAWPWPFWPSDIENALSLGSKLGLASGLVIGVVNALVLIRLFVTYTKAHDPRPDLLRTVNRTVLRTTVITGMPVLTAALMIVGFKLHWDNGFPQAFIAAIALACTLATQAAGKGLRSSTFIRWVDATA